MPRTTQSKRMPKRREMLQHLAAGWTGSTWSAASPRAAEAIEALQRMDNGTYGRCIDCNRKIPGARLRVKPEATRCIDCETQHERSTPVQRERSQLWCQILGEIDYAL